jgi:hypothetical protein
MWLTTYLNTLLFGGAPVALGIIGALAGVGGSILGSMFGGKKSKEEKAAMEAQTEQARMQTRLSQLLFQQGQGLGSLGRPALQQALQAYMTRSGAGGRSAMSAALLPETTADRQATRGAVTSLQSSLLDPTTRMMRRDLSGRIGNRFALARSEAIDRLGNMGMNLQNLMQGFGATGVQAGHSAGGIYSALAQQEASNRQQRQQNTQGVFGALGKFLQPYLNRQNTTSLSGGIESRSPVGVGSTVPLNSGRDRWGDPYGL